MVLEYLVLWLPQFFAKLKDQCFTNHSAMEVSRIIGEFPEVLPVARVKIAKKNVCSNGTSEPHNSNTLKH